MLSEEEIGVVFELLFGKSSAASHQKTTCFLVSSFQEESSVAMCERCVVVTHQRAFIASAAICVKLYL
jgi:hypothetical protein